MDDLLPLLSRWIHVGTAIVLVGGSVFMRFVLMPAAETLPEEQHLDLRAKVIKRWKMFVHIGVTLFLISGFYNYLGVTRFLHRGDKLYAALIGTKILLAFVVFFLGIALTGRSGWSEMFRKNAKKWLTINLLLAAIIVGISGFLKFRPAMPVAEETTQVQPE